MSPDECDSYEWGDPKNADYLDYILDRERHPE